MSNPKLELLVLYVRTSFCLASFVLHMFYVII